MLVVEQDIAASKTDRSRNFEPKSYLHARAMKLLEGARDQFCRSPAGYSLLENQNRNVRLGGSSPSPATLSHYFLRLPTICCEFARAIIAPRHPVFASGLRVMSRSGTLQS